MPIWARAIMFGIELVGFILLSIFVVKKEYEECKKKQLSVKDIKSNLTFDIIVFLINFAIILAVFLFVFPSYIFFSYNKLILVSVIWLLSISWILWALTDGSGKSIFFMFSTIVFFITTLLMTAGMAGGEIRMDNKTTILNPIIQEETITPTVFSENQVGNVYDAEGNLKTYVFYYKVNDVWHYKELDANTERVEIPDEDSYIKKTLTQNTYYNQEKKVTEEDYLCTETKEEYIIYINPKQCVNIKAD